jgi:hypothetical protein
MEEDVDLCCNSLHPQAQAPDDPLHDQGSQYSSRESLYLAPFWRRVPRPPTNQHFHFLLLQFLSQGNENLLSGKGRRTHLFESNNWLNPIFPSSFSVHPCQERPWANTDGSQGFSRLICWGYVQRLLIQGYVPGWIRFVRQDLVSVHSDGNVTCLLIWMYFYSGSRGDTVQTVTLYIPFCMDHLPKRHMMSEHD